jgi:hypothetical protein
MMTMWVYSKHRVEDQPAVHGMSSEWSRAVAGTRALCPHRQHSGRKNTCTAC